MDRYKEPKIHTYEKLDEIYSKERTRMKAFIE